MHGSISHCGVNGGMLAGRMHLLLARVREETKNQGGQDTSLAVHIATRLVSFESPIRGYLGALQVVLVDSR